MALSIKTSEADRLARELAAVTHESLTEAVTVALRERLERVRPQDPDAHREARIDRLIVTYQAQRLVDDRTPDEIVGYDEHGPPSVTLTVDTSAVVAILEGEPGSEWLRRELRDSRRSVMSAPTALELGMVLEGRGASRGTSAAALVDFGVDVTAFDDDLSARALDAWRRFGKRRHPAALNFGDCCTYALAQRERLPILCVGDDFVQTDLPVLRPPT